MKEFDQVVEALLKVPAFKDRMFIARRGQPPSEWVGYSQPDENSPEQSPTTANLQPFFRFEEVLDIARVHDWHDAVLLVVMDSPKDTHTPRRAYLIAHSPPPKKPPFFKRLFDYTGYARAEFAYRSRFTGLMVYTAIWDPLHPKAFKISGSSRHSDLDYVLKWIPLRPVSSGYRVVPMDNPREFLQMIGRRSD